MSFSRYLSWTGTALTLVACYSTNPPSEPPVTAPQIFPERVTLCQPDYHLKENSCAPNICVPNSSGLADCQDEIPNSAAAEQSKTCNAIGDEFVFGVCQATSCESGYYLSGNSCLPQVCTPDTPAPLEDCHNEILHSAVAQKPKTCNSIGDGFVFGACQVSTCEATYYLSENACLKMEGTIGVRNFRQLSGALSAVTGVPESNASVATYLATRKSSLSIDGDALGISPTTLLKSMELAAAYCLNAANSPNIRTNVYGNFDFAATPAEITDGALAAVAESILRAFIPDSSVDSAVGEKIQIVVDAMKAVRTAAPASATAATTRTNMVVGGCTSVASSQGFLFLH